LFRNQASSQGIWPTWSRGDDVGVSVGRRRGQLEAWRAFTYHVGILDELCNRVNDALDVLVALHEAQPFRPGDFANDVKGKVLQPSGEVAGGADMCEASLRLLDELGDGRVDEGLVLDERAHGIGTGDAATEARVVGLVAGGEETVETLAALYGRLNGVEGGLRRQTSA